MFNVELHSTLNVEHSTFILAYNTRRQMPDAPVLSVIVPCYNERATVAELLRRVREVPIDKEIIVIDDVSTDGSKDVVATLAKEHPEIRQILQPVNQGKGAAIRRGI